MLAFIPALDRWNNDNKKQRKVKNQLLGLRYKLFMWCMSIRIQYTLTIKLTIKYFRAQTRVNESPMEQSNYTCFFPVNIWPGMDYDIQLPMWYDLRSVLICFIIWDFFSLRLV